MRGGGYGLLAIGIIIAIVGLINHFVVKSNPFPHTSTILIAVGVILAVLGLIMSFMGGRSAAS
ncbi:MAG TPA: hypothetical protein VFQ32_05595 [Ktedonobacterales bacterium]|nr:hypothetical protein [Ktedonobacterales bacterium]